MASDVLSGILAKLNSAYRQARSAYFAFGDGILALRQSGMSLTAIVEYLKEHFPQAPTETGWVFTTKWASTASTLAEQFRADGGLVSPDGNHAVSREQLVALGLDQATLAKLASHILYSETAPKGAKKLRVSDVEAAVKRMASADTAEKVAAALAPLRERMAEVDDDIALRAAGDERGLLARKVTEMQGKLDKARTAVTKAEANLADALKALAEYDARHPQTPDNREIIKLARSRARGKVVATAAVPA